MNFGITSLLGNKQKIKRLSDRAEIIMVRTQELIKEPIETYPKITDKLKEKLKHGAVEDDILNEAYALVGAAATHVLGMTPYKVQIIGAIVLNGNMIAEMHTGEGKTLTATMPLYLNALCGKGAHLITANPYLAKRDATELKPLYNALGLSIGFTDEEEDDIKEKQKAYNADITYTTGAALGFDYLNDNLVQNAEETRQRGFNYVLLDEADSILLDNAQTPLIISGKGQNLETEYQKADLFVRELDKDSVLIEKEKHAVRLKPSGVMAAKEFYGDDLFVNQRANVHYIMNALQAHFLYQKGVDYLIVKESKKEGIKTVELVDLNTGRVLDGQRFSEGIHQALEAKEHTMIHSPNNISASITYQSLFSMYKKVAGMTGTAMTDKEELEAIYGLDVLPIPTNKPDRRTDYPDKVFANREEKYKAVAKKVQEYKDKGQPVLVGTTSVKNSEYLSKLLDRYGIDHETLNANNPSAEAKIVAKAGQKGAVTIATNMAGRGTDIKLEKGVEKLGGLVVLGTERHDSPRIDNQLRGRAARQGQPGITEFYVALDDDIFNKMKPSVLEHYRKKYKNTKGAIKNKTIDFLFNNVQKELAIQGYENRKADLTYENVIAKERESIYTLRHQIINNEYDLYKGLKKITLKVIDDYFKKIKSPKVTRSLIQKIQKDFINKNLSKEMLSLGSEKSYTNIKQIEKKIKSVTINELNYRKEILGERFSIVVSPIYLNVIDFYWSKEIAYLNDLKRMITLEGYRQANPYVEYQRRASDSFCTMLRKIRLRIFQIFYQLVIQIENNVVQSNLPNDIKHVETEKRVELDNKGGIVVGKN